MKLRDKAEQAVNELVDEWNANPLMTPAQLQGRIADAIERVAREFAEKALRAAYRYDDATTSAHSARLVQQLDELIAAAIAEAENG